jgi:hypothetical protein
MANTFENYSVTGENVPFTDFGKAMKISLAKNETQTWKSISSEFDFSAGFGQNLTNKLITVQFEIPPGVAVKPVIRARYTTTIEMPVGVWDPAETPTAADIANMTATAYNLFRPVPQPINKFLDFASVDMGTGQMYQTYGSQSYLVNQMFKSKEERESWASRLCASREFIPFKPDIVGTAIEAALRRTVPDDQGCIAGVTLTTGAGKYTMTKEWSTMQDVLAIEPFLSAYHGEQTAGIIGLDVINLKLNFRNQIWNNMVQFNGAMLVLKPETPEPAIDYAADYTFKLTGVQLGIEWVEYQSPIGRIARGISNHHYQRLEVWTLPGKVPDSSTVTFHFEITSIPQFFIIRQRLEDHEVKENVPLQFDGSIPSFTKFVARVSDLGLNYARLEFNDLLANMWRRGFDGARVPTDLYNKDGAPYIIFDPINDMPGLPRAAGMSSALTYDFDITTKAPVSFTYSNRLAYIEIIAVHYNPCGTRETRWEPSLSNFTHSEVLNVYKAVHNGTIKVDPTHTN